MLSLVFELVKSRDIAFVGDIAHLVYEYDEQEDADENVKNDAEVDQYRHLVSDSEGEDECTVLDYDIANYVCDDLAASGYEIKPAKDACERSNEEEFVECRGGDSQRDEVGDDDDGRAEDERHVVGYGRLGLACDVVCKDYFSDEVRHQDGLDNEGLENDSQEVD